MLTRPLELASRLRTTPKNFDALFLVNGGLILLFFQLFGSRFVLAPGLGVDFQMAQIPAASLGRARTTSAISVKRDGLIFAERGQVTLSQLREWLKEQAVGIKQPVLLVRPDANVINSVMTEIIVVAHEEGFSVIWGAEEATALSSSPR